GRPDRCGGPVGDEADHAAIENKEARDPAPRLVPTSRHLPNPRHISLRHSALTPTKPGRGAHPQVSSAALLMRGRRRPPRTWHAVRFTRSGHTVHVLDDGKSAMQRFTWLPRRVLPGATVAALGLTIAGVGRADTHVDRGRLQSTGLVEVPDCLGRQPRG